MNWGNYNNYPDIVLDLIRKISDSFIEVENTPKDKHKFVDQAAYDVYSEMIFNQYITTGDAESLHMNTEDESIDLANELLLQYHLIELESKGLIESSAESNKAWRILPAGEKVALESAFLADLLGLIKSTDKNDGMAE